MTSIYCFLVLIFSFSFIGIKSSDSSLIEASYNENVDAFVKMLKLNQSLGDQKEANGKSLLHIAAIEGNIQMIKYLVEEQHVEINKTDDEGCTALYSAVVAGRLESVKLLLDFGADKNITPYNDTTLLHRAADDGNIEMMRLLLQYFDVDVRNSDGQTAAFIAVEENKSEALNFLLENGADPYARQNDGSTLLHAAVRTREIDLVRRLIQYKDLINAKTNTGAAPIDSIMYGLMYLDMVKELVEAGSYVPDRLIWNFFDTRKYDVVKYLVTKSGKINVRITYDRRDCRESLLMIILFKKNPPMDLLKFILDQGADVNIKYCMNITALHRVAILHPRKQSFELVDLLLAKGADINAVDIDGFTPLDYGNIDFAEYLVKFGGVTGKKKQLNTLITSAETDDLENFETTLKSSPNLLTQRGEKGMSFLHIAALHGSQRIIDYMVQVKHFNIDQEDEEGSTPLSRALEAEQHESVLFLLDLGADKNKLKQPFRDQLDSIEKDELDLLRSAANDNQVPENTNQLVDEHHLNFMDQNNKSVQMMIQFDKD